MTFIFRSTTISFAIICAAGLLASCTSTPAHKVVLTPTSPTATTAVAVQEATSLPTTPDHAITIYQPQTTQERIETLQENQLQAFNNKCTYSPKKIEEVVHPQITPTQQTPQPKKELTAYIVQSGENLYSIAARKNIYHEGLLWPLIYKANRDQIKDPQQIFPGQTLTITRQHSDDEKENARETARNSGIFIQPHDS